MLHLEELLLVGQSHLIEDAIINGTIKQKIDGKFLIVFGVLNGRAFVNTKSFYTCKKVSKNCYSEKDVDKFFIYKHVISCLKRVIKIADEILPKDKDIIFEGDVLIQKYENRYSGNILTYDFDIDQKVQNKYIICLHGKHPFPMHYERFSCFFYELPTKELPKEAAPLFYNVFINLPKFNYINLDNDSIVFYKYFFNYLTKNFNGIYCVDKIMDVLYNEFIPKFTLEKNDGYIIAGLNHRKLSINIDDNFFKTIITTTIEIQKAKQKLLNCEFKNFLRGIGCRTPIGEGLVLTYNDLVFKIIDRSDFSAKNFASWCLV